MTHTLFGSVCSESPGSRWRTSCFLSITAGGPGRGCRFSRARLSWITAVAGFLVAGLASPKLMADTTWKGGNGSWFVGGNWLNGNVPVAFDNVIINSGNPQIASTGAVAADVQVGYFLGGQLTVTGGGTLNSSSATIGNNDGRAAG